MITHKILFWVFKTNIQTNTHTHALIRTRTWIFFSCTFETDMFTLKKKLILLSCNNKIEEKKRKITNMNVNVCVCTQMNTMISTCLLGLWLTFFSSYSSSVNWWWWWQHSTPLTTTLLLLLLLIVMMMMRINMTESLSKSNFSHFFLHFSFVWFRISYYLELLRASHLYNKCICWFFLLFFFIWIPISEFQLYVSVCVCVFVYDFSSIQSFKSIIIKVKKEREKKFFHLII